jgi:gamma-glutamyltranspeptidase/glutathione hydrolase
MRLVLAACLFAGTAAAQEAVQPEATLDLQESRRAEGAAFMVAAANPLAALAGYDALAAGGTAADAAVAVQFMLNLVEPQSSGIGGGAFALYWDAETQSLTSFDGRERAPLAADETYWLGADGEPIGWWEAVVGGRSVGVPGTLKLLETLHAREGVCPGPICSRRPSRWPRRASPSRRDWPG